jgi:GDPmannose 4,6-dehydratase
MKKAIITGITGQDGSYLAELLLVKGYQVHGIIRKSSVFTTQRLKTEVWKHPNCFAHHGDLADSSNLHRQIVKVQPDAIYNLGAQSHVAVSFEELVEGMVKYDLEFDNYGRSDFFSNVKTLVSKVRDFEIVRSTHSFCQI